MLPEPLSHAFCLSSLLPASLLLSLLQFYQFGFKACGLEAMLMRRPRFWLRAQLHGPGLPSLPSVVLCGTCMGSWVARTPALMATLPQANPDSSAAVHMHCLDTCWIQRSSGSRAGSAVSSREDTEWVGAVQSTICWQPGLVAPARQPQGAGEPVPTQPLKHAELPKPRPQASSAQQGPLPP